MTQPENALLQQILCPNPPAFAVLYRPDHDPATAQLMVGDVVAVPSIADLPEPGRAESGRAEPGSGGLDVLAIVPHRQILERGFEAVDDGAPLLALRAHSQAVIPLAELLPMLPEGPESFRGNGYDVADADYERMVRDVLAEEIGAGAGSNFVIHRCLTGRLDPASEPAARAALGGLRRLLLAEGNTYWTFAVHTPELTLLGASPERHVSVQAGIVRMNPISGTLRHPRAGFRDAAAQHAAELAFLADPKERDELSMVLDEELKLMAAVCELGGRVRGPYLKRMAHLAHTEYLIEGRTARDVRDVLRATMFAPTVTGSPMRNACRVIARRERRGRRYYGGVLALIGRDGEGGQTLDAPILIRTAEIATDGRVRIPAGATLVRGSDPASELAETRAKAAGILAALIGPPATVPAQPPAPTSTSAPTPTPASTPAPAGSCAAEIARVLAERNRTLAGFWMHERPAGGASASAERLTGRVLLIDAEDDFTGMLALMLRSLGLVVDVAAWDALGTPSPAADLLVIGPGPGDPRDLGDPRIHALHALAAARLAARAPVLGVCLGHQVLAHALGLPIRRLPAPDQGRQSSIDLFGTQRRVGFYNSYVACAPASPMPGFAFSLDTLDSLDGLASRVHALRGPAVTGLQFHAESVLTSEGPAILHTELARLLTARRVPCG